MPPLHTESLGSGPPVVCLHGQPGSGADWRWVAPLLADDFTVLMPDRPGYGLTGGSATGFAGNASAVVDLCDRLGHDRVVLVAHSWAGGVAIAAAAQHPDRVAGLVLVSSVGPGERFHWDDRLLAAPILGELIAALVIGTAGAAVGNRRVRSLADRRAAGRARDAFDSVQSLTRGGSRVWRSFVVEQRAMLEELGALGATLASIAVPVVVLHGANDRIVPARVGRSVAGRVPAGRYVELAGTGHLVPHDAPAAVADAVRRVSGPGPG